MTLRAEEKFNLSLAPVRLLPGREEARVEKVQEERSMFARIQQ